MATSAIDTTVATDHPHTVLDGSETPSKALSASRMASGRYWMDRPNAVAATLAECASHVPPGWRPLLARTLVKLLAVVEGRPARRAAVGQLQVCVGGAELWCVGVDETDDVVEGILLKMARSSHHVCKCCGRRARPRRASDLTDDDGRCIELASVLCPRCAAPWLLQHDLRRLAQSMALLRRLNLPIAPAQIPVLLRAHFRQQADRLGRLRGWQVSAVRMSPQAFLDWARDWQVFSAQLVVDAWA